MGCHTIISGDLLLELELDDVGLEVAENLEVADVGDGLDVEVGAPRDVILTALERRLLADADAVVWLGSPPDPDRSPPL